MKIFETVLNYIIPILAYLLGSISPAKMIASSKKISLEDRGQNPGTAGVYRTFGIWAAVSVFFIDIIKGLIPVITAKLLDLSEWTVIASALLAVAGHNWPVYHKFRGGGGLATSLPLVAYLLPRELLIALPVAVIAGFVTRWIPFGGIVGLPLLIILALIYREPVHLVIFILLLTIIMLTRRLGFLVVFLRKKMRIADSKIQEKS